MSTGKIVAAAGSSAGLPVRRCPRGRGFTLVEALVFGAIGLAMVIVAWTVFQQSARKGKATDEKLQATQSVLFLSLHLEKDLESLYEDPDHLMEFTVDPGASRLSFYRFGPVSHEHEWESVPLQKVVYYFDGASGKVHRQVDAEPTKVFVGSFERLNFRLADPPPSGAVPLTGGLLAEAPAILISSVGISDEALAWSEDERKPAQRCVMVNAVPRGRVSAFNAYPSWNPVPYGP